MDNEDTQSQSNLIPSDDTQVPNQQSIPAVPDDNIAVPQDMAVAGHDTNEPQADSPESLDQELNQGADRQNIDPSHSFDTNAGSTQAQSIVNPQPQDNDTPFSPPTDPVDDAAVGLDQRTASGQLDDTHQATDTNVDSHQAYDEGLAGAAEAQEPNAGNAVVDFDPEKDQTQQDGSTPR
jgi:hypothetical protein